MKRLGFILEMVAKMKNVEKARKETRGLKKDMDEAADHAERLNRNVRSGGAGGGGGPGVVEQVQRYRGQRGITGGRGGTGRNFSGIASSMGAGALGGSLVGAYASIAANIFAISAAFESLSRAAGVQQLTDGLELMGARSGVALKLTADGLKEVTGNAISTADAFRSVAQASSAGLGAEEIERLGGVARGAALALGRDTSEAMDRLTRGAIKLEPELLDELGIMVRLDEASREYARANRKTVASLTLTEKRQAFLNAVLAEGEGKFGDIVDQLDTNPYNKLSAAVRDQATEFGRLVNTILGPVAKVVAENPFTLLAPAVFLLTKALQGLGLQAQITGVTVSKAFDTLGNTAKLKAITTSAGSQGVVAQVMAREGEIKSLEKVDELFDKATESMDKYGMGLSAVEEKEVEHAKGMIKSTIASQSKKDAIVKLLKSVGRSIIMFAAMAAVTLAINMAFNYVQKAIQNFNKELIESNKRLKELVESSKETVRQVKLMQDVKVDTFAESIDASLTSLKALNTELTKNLKLRFGLSTTREKDLAEQGAGLGVAVGTREVNVSAGAYSNIVTITETIGDRLENINGINEDVVNNLGLQVDLLAGFNLEGAKRFTQELAIIANMEDQTEQKQALLELQEQLGVDLETYKGTYASIVEITKDLKKNLSDILPKELETAPIKSIDSFRMLNTELDNVFQSNVAIGEKVVDIGKEELQILNNLGAAFGNGNFELEGTINQLEKVTTSNEKILSLNNQIANAVGDARQELQTELNKELEDRRGLLDLLGYLFNSARKRLALQLETARQAFVENEIKKATLAIEHKIEELEEKRLMTNIKIRQEAEKAARARDLLGFTPSGFATTARSLASQNQLLQEEVRTLEDRKTRIAETFALQRAGDRIALQAISTMDGKVRKANEGKEEEMRLLQEKLRVSRELEEEEKRQLDLAITGNMQKVTALAEEIAAYNDIDAAQKRNIENTLQQINHDRELYNLYKDRVDILLKAETLNAERSAREAGLAGISARDQRRLDRLKLEGQLAQERTEASLAQSEFDQRKALLELEKKVVQADLEASRALLIAAEALVPESDTIGRALISNAIGDIGNIIDDSGATFDTALNNMEELNRESQKNSELRQKNLLAELSAIPQTFKEVGDGIVASIRQNLAMSVRGIGLSGQAQSFYESETAGVTDKDERERIRRQAAGIQFMEQAAGGTVKILEEVESGFADVFQGIIDGSDSAGEAFKNMANAILQAFTRMIAEMIASQLMSGTASLLGNLLSFLPIFAGGAASGGAAGGGTTPTKIQDVVTLTAAAGGIMAYANGGIIKPRDGTEGVITRPTYLVGEGRYNEAVVPLPNGRAIPVQMHGGQGQNNNVTVNISMDGQGNSKEAPDLTSLGGLVAQAVQRELQEQKRPGGILNRYGAA